MIWKTCIKTPAGETHADEITTADNLEEHALQAPLRVTISNLMGWLDSHTEWGSGTPKTDPPVKGNGMWEIFMHPSDEHCDICMPPPEPQPVAEPPPPPEWKPPTTYVTGITITPADPTVVQGSTLQLIAIAGLSDSSTQDVSTAVTWSVIAPDLCTIDQSGLLHATGYGTVNITAAFASYGHDGAAVIVPVP
jgi:hypothetical protein